MKRLEMISRSIKRAEESTFIIAEGGKKNTYIVVNQETNKGYTIKVKGKLVVIVNTMNTGSCLVSICSIYYLKLI